MVTVARVTGYRSQRASFSVGLIPFPQLVDEKLPIQACALDICDPVACFILNIVLFSDESYGCQMHLM